MTQNLDNPHEHLSAYLDGELSAEQADALKALLAEDTALRGELASLEAVKRSVEGLAKVPAPPTLHEAIIERLERHALLTGVQAEPPSRGWSLFARLTATAAAILLGVSVAIMVYQYLPAPGDNSVPNQPVELAQAPQDNGKENAEANARRQPPDAVPAARSNLRQSGEKAADADGKVADARDLADKHGESLGRAEKKMDLKGAGGWSGDARETHDLASRMRAQRLTAGEVRTHELTDEQITVDWPVDSAAEQAQANQALEELLKRNGVVRLAGLDDNEELACNDRQIAYRRKSADRNLAAKSQAARPTEQQVLLLHRDVANQLIAYAQDQSFDRVRLVVADERAARGLAGRRVRADRLEQLAAADRVPDVTAKPGSAAPTGMARQGQAGSPGSGATAAKVAPHVVAPTDTPVTVPPAPQVQVARGPTAGPNVAEAELEKLKDETAAPGGESQPGEPATESRPAFVAKMPAPAPPPAEKPAPAKPAATPVQPGPAPAEPVQPTARPDEGAQAPRQPARPSAESPAVPPVAVAEPQPLASPPTTQPTRTEEMPRLAEDAELGESSADQHQARQGVQFNAPAPPRQGKRSEQSEGGRGRGSARPDEWVSLVINIYVVGQADANVQADQVRGSANEAATRSINERQSEPTTGRDEP